MGHRIAVMAALAVSVLAATESRAGQGVAPQADATSVRGQSEQLQGVGDPRQFVGAIYETFARSEEPMTWPEHSYSPRLRALFADYDAWTAAQDGLIGELDFDWWVNAQDWGIGDVEVSEAIENSDRRIETVRFMHGDRREELRLRFVRQGGRWYLDDASEGSGHGGDGWTLSELLSARPE